LQSKTQKFSICNLHGKNILINNQTLSSSKQQTNHDICHKTVGLLYAASQRTKSSLNWMRKKLDVYKLMYIIRSLCSPVDVVSIVDQKVSELDIKNYTSLAIEIGCIYICKQKLNLYTLRIWNPRCNAIDITSQLLVKGECNIIIEIHKRM